ncbi:YlxQ family RNA-binding protein [Exiguobacterium flavidum]|uniref:YlxQ family RNA-binding protein n=1 Tax=Exiguobacterium flavidum TaxID=2184695 RepID=UPI000DF7503C|nr:YlxQ family RNA-binding protein [Exiguobacterium flavidum]
MSKWESLLGLANRARKVTTGEELVLKEVRGGQAKLVLLAADAGPATRKKVTDKCNSYDVPYLLVADRFVLGQALGKEARVVVAVNEAGFAKKLTELLSQD